MGLEKCDHTRICLAHRLLLILRVKHYWFATHSGQNHGLCGITFSTTVSDVFPIPNHFGVKINDNRFPLPSMQTLKNDSSSFRRPVAFSVLLLLSHLLWIYVLYKSKTAHHPLRAYCAHKITIVVQRDMCSDVLPENVCNIEAYTCCSLAAAGCLRGPQWRLLGVIHTIQQNSYTLSSYTEIAIPMFSYKCIWSPSYMGTQHTQSLRCMYTYVYLCGMAVRWRNVMRLAAAGWRSCLQCYLRSIDHFRLRRRCLPPPPSPFPSTTLPTRLPLFWAQLSKIWCIFPQLKLSLNICTKEGDMCVHCACGSTISFDESVLGSDFWCENVQRRLLCHIFQWWCFISDKPFQWHIRSHRVAGSLSSRNRCYSALRSPINENMMAVE